MSWKGKPSDFSIKILADADEHVRKVAGDVLQGVIVSSPVDTGQFRSNHRVSIDNPDNGYDNGNGNTSPRGTLDADTYNKGLNVLKSAKIGNLVYIQNNLPYAERIENGWSAEQAPEGVYAITFLAVSEKYR